MKQWKVKYQDLRALRGRYPFSDWEEIVSAPDRKSAIAIVRNKWDCFGNYGNYKASPVKLNLDN